MHRILFVLFDGVQSLDVTGPFEVFAGANAYSRRSQYGLLIFDGAEELDFVGPWEVFTASSMLRDNADTVLLLAERPAAIHSSLRAPPA